MQSPGTDRAFPVEDELARAVSADGSLAVRAIVGTALVEQARRRHQLTPTNAGALGRARGTVSHPEIDLPAVAGHPDVSGAIGEGTLSVVRMRWCACT